MKRQGNLIEKIADPENLRRAFWKAARRKSSKGEVLFFRSHLHSNLIRLRQSILEGRVEVGNYHYFNIYDPKERMICAASFPERVLHHALMNVCHPAFEQFQIYDSYATRKGKGTFAALNRARNFHRKNDWYLKLDVAKYFNSIDHTVLMNLLERRFKDRQLRAIFFQIIDSYHCAAGKGLPIGNLTSQYFANHYLAYADRLIKEKFRVKSYLRYMDDMVLWSNDREKLKSLRKEIAFFLDQHLKLRLKIASVNRSHHGLTLIGYRLFPRHVRLSPVSKARFKRRIFEYSQKLQNGEWTQADFQRHVFPVLSHAMDHAETRGLRKNVLKESGL